MAGEPQFVEHARDGDVHVLRLANPPVNTLRTEVRSGLLDEIKAATREGARAIVLIGSGRNFSAGAEMTEFGKPREAALPAGGFRRHRAFENPRHRGDPCQCAGRRA